MKRKLLCIFFMLTGVATIAGAILHSLKRPENADVSPLYTLIILSAVTIIAAAWNVREPYKPELSERDSKIQRVYRTVNILAILVCLAFVILMLFMTDDYTDSMRHITFLMILAGAGIILAAYCLKERPPIIRRDIAKTASALLISAMLIVVYLTCMPKYSLDDSITRLRTEKENAENYIFDLSDYNISLVDSYAPRWAGDMDAAFGPNPFYIMMYQFGCDSYRYDADGLHIVKGYINYNPANGAYEFARAQEQDLVFGPGEWPVFNYNFLYDNDGQHSAVLNLFIRELDDSDWVKYDASSTLIVGSGEWDAKLKDVMYPHNFPEDEARTFLKSMGEEALKTKLLKQINELNSEFNDKMIEVYFFGIDIATYQNGEIVLKG